VKSVGVDVGQGDQTSLLKHRPKMYTASSVSGQNYYVTVTVEKNSQTFLASYVFCRKLPKENNHPNGENSTKSGHPDVGAFLCAGIFLRRIERLFRFLTELLRIVFPARVARWYIFTQKIQIWVNFRGLWNGTCCYILWPFANFMAVWYIICPFG
jgi:hypothetical protein